MAIPIGVSAAKLRRAQQYFYEKLVYTGWPFSGTAGASSLATGITQLFNTSAWNEAGQPTVRAAVEMIAATQKADVAFTWSVDPGNQRAVENQGDLGSARAGLRAMPARIAGVDTMQAQLNNTTGAAIAAWQTNLSVSARRLTIMDKVAAQLAGLQSQRGAYNLTDDEQRALTDAGMTIAQVQGLVQKGTLPYTTEQWLRLLIETHTVELHDDLFSVAVSASDNPFVTYTAALDGENPTRGRFLVLDQVAVEGATNATFTVNRDADTDSYWQLNGAAFTQSDDAPWDVFLAAFQHMTVHAINGPGGAGGTAQVRLRIREVQMSDLFAALTGRTKNLPGKTYSKALVGLMSS